MLVFLNYGEAIDIAAFLRRCAADLQMPFVEVVERSDIPAQARLVVIAAADDSLADSASLPLPRLRLEHPHCALMLLLAEASTKRVVGLLESGADDVLASPYGYAELRARCNSLIRRQRALDDNREVNLGDFSYNSGRRRVKFKDCELSLRRREFELLRYFLDNANRPLSRDQLLAQVWSDNPILNDNNLDVQIRQLRQKFGEQGRDYITTVHGYGYKFSAEGKDKADKAEKELA